MQTKERFTPRRKSVRFYQMTSPGEYVCWKNMLIEEVRLWTIIHKRFVTHKGCNSLISKIVDDIN